MKRRVLSGNYLPPREAKVDVKEEKEDFEKAALARLGGSVAFVRGRKLVEQD